MDKVICLLQKNIFVWENLSSHDKYQSEVHDVTEDDMEASSHCTS